MSRKQFEGVGLATSDRWSSQARFTVCSSLSGLRSVKMLGLRPGSGHREGPDGSAQYEGPTVWRLAFQVWGLWFRLEQLRFEQTCGPLRVLLVGVYIALLR